LACFSPDIGVFFPGYWRVFPRILTYFSSEMHPANRCGTRVSGRSKKRKEKREKRKEKREKDGRSAE
jgi:hypothetical protein